MEMGTQWEGGEDEVSFSGGGYKKPSGFEGVKTSSSKTGKGKSKGMMMGMEQSKWGKRGETREWDREKPTREEYELGSEEDDRRILEGLDRDDSDEDSESESESDDDDEEEIRKMLMSAKALDNDKKRSTLASKEKKELIEKEIRREEEKRMMGGGGGARRKDKGGNKKVRK